MRPPRCRPFLRSPAFLSLLTAPLVFPACSTVGGGGARSDTPDYNRDVRPILAENCFGCHGPDSRQRKADLRLDLRDAAVKPLESGAVPIVPGKPDESAVIRRVSSRVEKERMPPAKTGRRLNGRQIDVLKRWIAQGAVWKPHWAYIRPERPPLPDVKDPGWCRNPIDRFVLARLEAEGLRPSPETDKSALLRRVSLDLTGLPPTSAELDAFLADAAPDAYEKVVDRLLASPHYGERMAIEWLDEARYGDTNGYHIDNHRDVWLWRNWVIDTFNRNLPFDRFTIEQIAGDLLPQPTVEQKIATGFNRNHMVTFEGGAIEDEYATIYVKDRVITTSTVWLGSTLKCCECHDHKYDPFTQKEFYQLYAFFNNVPEKGLDGTKESPAPRLKVPSTPQAESLATVRAKIADVEKELKDVDARQPEAQAAWEAEVLAHPEKNAPPPGAVGHWPLDESEGTKAAPGGAGPAAEWKGEGTPAWVPGRLGGAVRFDARGWFECGDAGDFERTDAFTACAWILTSGGDGAIVARIDDAHAHRGWELAVQGKKLCVHLVHDWPDNVLRVLSADPLPLGAWTHVAMTYDGSGKSGGLRMFVNGTSREIEVRRDVLSDTIRTPAATRIGRRNDSNRIVGSIDDVRLYPRALTEREIGLIMGQALNVIAAPASAPPTATSDGTPAATGARSAVPSADASAPAPAGKDGSADGAADALQAALVARYPFDEKEGSKAAEASGHGPDAAYRGEGAPEWIAGKIDGAVKLDAKKGYFDCGAVGDFERTDAFAVGCWVNTDGADGTIVSRMDDANAVRGWDLTVAGGKKLYVHLIHKWPDNCIRVISKEPLPTGAWTHVLMTYDGSGKAAGVRLYVNGRTQAFNATHDTLSDTIRTDKPMHIGRRHASFLYAGLIDDVRLYNRALAARDVARVMDRALLPVLSIPAAQRTDAQRKELADYFRNFHFAERLRVMERVAKLREEEAAIDRAIPTTMVMEEMAKPREAHLLIRGDYQRKSDVMAPGVPAALPPLPSGAPPNRLALAKWLVSRDNPLTARVRVNRFWQRLFGTGLVKTSEDFGTRAEWPSHPELLDWLAVHFMEDANWDVKAVQRLIVTSATYRQASACPKALVERDPENRLLARGPRFRLPAEIIRDAALSAAGLLDLEIGGPSVSPYQPPGLWEQSAFGAGFTAQSYSQSKGKDQYRRGLYTYWKRSMPYASFAIFDAPPRETCTVNRPRTNTPLQALALLNDPVYVEAARGLAQRMMKEAGPDAPARLDRAFRLCLARPPAAREKEILLAQFDRRLAEFRKDTATATQFLSVGDWPRPPDLDVPELAAWTAVAGVILNLDEFITK